MTLQKLFRLLSLSLDDVNRRLSLAADHIIAWADRNNLDINVNKTKAIPFGSPAFIRDLPLVAQSYIEIGNSRVYFESSLKKAWELCWILLLPGKNM